MIKWVKSVQTTGYNGACTVCRTTYKDNNRITIAIKGTHPKKVPIVYRLFLVNCYSWVKIRRAKNFSSCTIFWILFYSWQLRKRIQKTVAARKKFGLFLFCDGFSCSLSMIFHDNLFLAAYNIQNFHFEQKDYSWI